MTILDGLAVVAGSCAGGFVSGVSGFAFGMVAMICWVWRIDPQLVAPMVVFGSLVSQGMSITSTRGSLDWRLLAPMLVGGLGGVPVGILLLSHINVILFKGTVGAVIILFSLMLMFASARMAVRSHGCLGEGLAGAVGGVMGGLCGLNGPAAVLWSMARGWDKDTQRSVTQIFFLATQAVTMTGYALSGKLTLPILEIFALMLPAVLIGTRLGNRICERIDTAQFRRVVLVILLVSGSVLLVSAALAI